MCNVHLNYKESKNLNGLCPRCNKPLTIGVEYRTEQLADRLLSWARSESIDRSFNYQREKYISAMLWDILKYDAHVDGAVTIKNQRKPVFNNISDLQEASFIRDAGIDLSVPERLTESELQTIIDNCYFDVSPIGRGPDVRLRQELTIQRMKQWFKNEQ